MLYLIKSAWIYAEKDRWKLVLFCTLHSLSFCGMLVKPYAFGQAINALQIHGIINLYPAVQWLGLYVAGFFVFEIFHRLGQYFEVTTALKNQERFVNAMYRRICNLPLQWHAVHHSGDVVNRVNTAGQALRSFTYAAYTYLECLFLSVGPIIFLGTISWQIAAISMFFSVTNLTIVESLNKKIQAVMHRQNECNHVFTARLIDFVSNIRTIISFRIGNETGWELKQKFDDFYLENMNEFKLNQPRCFLIGFGIIFTELAVISYYLWSLRTAMLPLLVGNMVMIVSYFREISEVFFRITSSFYDTMRWKQALKSTDPIIQGGEGPGSEAPAAAPAWERVSIRELDFHYSQESPALSGLSLDLTRAENIAVVGASGSGKSSLLHILAGLYCPDRVRMTMDGESFDNLQPLAGSALLIPQDLEIFEGTIQYNITFGLDCSREELNQVVDTAQLRDVVQRLPEGIHTDIREKGVNLSGGERQRLALARGLFFAKNKALLLLDEITSSVDARNERLIFAQILEKYRHRSIIATIHRLHLLDMFDTVVVMEEGRIVQRGKRQTLINVPGPFSTLWDMYMRAEKTRDSAV